ncbi:MAG: hypothetical protein ACE5LU_22655 [Anaerolineae bacterium]
MCYTDRVFWFKVLGPAVDVVHEGETFTHQMTDVHPRWAKVEELAEPVTVEIKPQLYTVIAGHTCPSEWGGWSGRSGFLTFYEGLHSADDLGYKGETTWQEGDEYRSSPPEHPGLILDYRTPYRDYQAGMCDLAVRLIEVTGVNPHHLLFWTGSSREWGPALVKRDDEPWNTYWEGFAAANEVNGDPWTVWYDLKDPYGFYPNLIHLNHAEGPVAAIQGLELSLANDQGEVRPWAINKQLEAHLGGSDAYRAWKREVWQREWPPTFWVINGIMELKAALAEAPAAEDWRDDSYLVVKDFDAQILVSHQPARELLIKLGELGLVSWSALVDLKQEGETKRKL